MFIPAYNGRTPFFIISIKTGSDINTGLPIYQMQATNLMRLMKVPKELIKKTGNEGKGMYR